MSAFIRAILLSVLSVGTNAHLCLLSPRQRGTMDGLNAALASDCFLTKGPCGDRPMGPVQAYIRAGRNHTVVFQKNYSHFMASSPGTLEVNLGVDSADGIGMVENLASWPDMDDDPLTLYTVDVWVPDNAQGRYVLQAVYTTNNPEAPAAFYQCSDILVI